ncbi:TPA: hypothetical protein H1Q05_001431 [Salmonella enterica]|nr:hypothetical protein [Salmonella enterica]
MANGTGIKTGTVPATGRAITGFGTGGTGGTAISRFFPGEFRAQIFEVLIPHYLTIK